MTNRFGRRRIFYVPTRRDLTVLDAAGHWMGSHGDLFAKTPEIGEYVQHQPPPDEQERLRGFVCSEISFVDKETERRAFTCDYYVTNVIPDEASFLQRDEGWMALIRTSEQIDGPTGPWEVLGFGWGGDGLSDGVAAELLDFDRPGPRGGPAKGIIASASSRAQADAIRSSLGADVAFVAQRRVFVE